MKMIIFWAILKMTMAFWQKSNEWHYKDEETINLFETDEIENLLNE